MNRNIKKPFYKKWWFIALCAAGVVGALGGGERPNEVDEVSSTIESSILDTTSETMTSEEIFVVKETSTSRPIETTTSIESTTVLETTTVIETTTIAETTTIPETTVTETTTVPKTTVPETTIPETTLAPVEMYASSSVNVRSGSGTGYDVVGVIEPGSSVNVISNDGEWSEIQYGSSTAFISSQYLADSYTPPETTTQQVVVLETTQQSIGRLVWIPRTGSKYHSNPSCSNMKNPSQVGIDTAQQMGFTACKKCY